MNENHADVKFVVGDEVALLNLGPVIIGLSLSSFLRGIWQVCTTIRVFSQLCSSPPLDIETAALSWFEVVFLGLRDGHTVFAQGRFGQEGYNTGSMVRTLRSRLTFSISLYQSLGTKIPYVIMCPVSRH